MMRIDAAGTIRGAFFAPVATGITQVRLVTQDGNGATAAVLGHVTALAYRRGDITALCPDVPVEPAGCTIDGAFYLVDFVGIENNDQLFDDVNTSLTIYNGYVDAVQRFEDNASLAIELSWGSTGGSFLADFADSVSWPLVPFDDVTVVSRYEFEAGFDPAYDGAYGDANGLWVMSFETDDRADLGAYGANWRYHMIVIRDSNVYLVWDLYNTPEVTLIAPAATWLGAPVETRVRFQTVSATEFSITIEHGPTCDDLTQVFTATKTYAGAATPTVSYVYGIGYSGAPASPYRMWQYQYAFVGAP